VYAEYARFYEGMLAEMKRAMPGDSATRIYEAQLAKVRRKTAAQGPVS